MRPGGGVAIPGAQGLDFRDVELFPDGSAVLMTAGQPARLYRLAAGDGAVALAHESPHETAFFDAVAFWDAERGLAFSDPVDGRFLVLHTEDGGRSWRELSPDAFPLPVEGEAGFAASGSNLAVGAGGLGLDRHRRQRGPRASQHRLRALLAGDRRADAAG